MLVVTSFTSDKCFGEVDIGQRILEGNITAGRQQGASCAVIPTTVGLPSAASVQCFLLNWKIHDLFMI
jgi:hypothetical protein